MTTYTFRIVVEPDEDRWRAYAPALEAQGAATWGYTREEALANIREVLEMIVGELAEEGRVGAGRRCGRRGALGRGHGMTDIPWGALRSLRPAKLSVLSSATASRSTTSADRTSATVTGTVGE